jgi:chromosomal replication initiation ATPase DnaA
MKISEEYKLGYEAGWLARELLVHEPTVYCVNAEKIVGIVCGYFQTELKSLQSKSRQRHIVYPRQLCMYFLKSYTGLTQKIIGEMFGSRDHTTVIHAVASITDLLDVDAIVQRDVKILTETILNNTMKQMQESELEEPCY